MPMFILLWEVESVEKRRAFVEAESEMEAYEAWRDGRFDDEWVIEPMRTEETLLSTEEIVDHDKLCCCPQCAGAA